MNDQDLDKLIKESLTVEEAAYYDQLDEPNLIDKMYLIYSGKLKWISIIQSITMAGLFIFGVYAAIQFFNSSDVVVMIKWGFASMLSIIASSMVKLLLMQYMQEQSVYRQIKRLELQLSHFIKHNESS